MATTYSARAAEPARMTRLEQRFAGVIRWAHVSPRVDHLPDIYELFTALDELTGRREAA